MENTQDTRESLLIRRTLLKLAKEINEPTQRRALFKIVCKVKGKCCKVVIDSWSIDNLVSNELVENLNFKRMKHPTPYKVSWFQKGHQLLVNEQHEVDLQLGSYKA